MSDINRQTVGSIPVKTIGEMLDIVTHPAFWLGALDAAAGKPTDHDDILGRIKLARKFDHHWSFKYLTDGTVFTSDDPFYRADAVELAQYRYEEGRLITFYISKPWRSWSHPAYPPKPVIDFIVATAARHS